MGSRKSVDAGTRGRGGQKWLSQPMAGRTGSHWHGVNVPGQGLYGGVELQWMSYSVQNNRVSRHDLNNTATCGVHDPYSPMSAPRYGYWWLMAALPTARATATR